MSIVIEEIAAFGFGELMKQYLSLHLYTPQQRPGQIGAHTALQAFR